MLADRWRTLPKRLEDCRKAYILFHILRHITFLTLLLPVLALDPVDRDALQAKLWLLFKTSKYQAALELTENNPDLFNFERAYALYRLQREDDAAALIANVDESDRSVAILKAQIVCCNVTRIEDA